MSKCGRKRAEPRSRSALEKALWVEANRQGLSYAKLALASGFSPGTLRNAYHGQCSLKTWQAEILAQVLGFSLAIAPRKEEK